MKETHIHTASRRRMMNDIASEPQKQNKLLSRKLSNLKCLLQAQHIHPATFEKYNHAFEGKDAVLVCTGPTAKYYSPLPDAVHIGVNGAVYLQHIQLDYAFVQDYTVHQRGNETLLNDILAYEGNRCKKFFGIIPDDMLDDVKKNIERIPARYLHAPNVAKYILEDWPLHNIASDLSYEPVGNFYGTTFSALQFILYAHPKRIYLVGWDCSAGYAYDKPNALAPANYQIEILKKYFVPFLALSSDIEIISVNPVGLTGIFKDVYTRKYQAEHPELNCFERL